MLRQIIKTSSIRSYVRATKNNPVSSQQQQQQSKQPNSQPQAQPQNTAHEAPITSFDEKWNEYFEYDPFIDENTNPKGKESNEPKTTFGE